MPMPGIEVGDIGPKLGHNIIDNGYLSFNKVRIPKENIMMRFQQIQEDGTLVSSGDVRLLY